MMTRMTRMTRMMTRSCQRRERDHRAQFSGTRKQFSPPLILINTFLKMFTSIIQHYHRQVFIVGGYNRETNNYDGATIILDPQSKWLHINNFVFQNSWEDTFWKSTIRKFFSELWKKGSFAVAGTWLGRDIVTRLGKHHLNVMDWSSRLPQPLSKCSKSLNVIKYIIYINIIVNVWREKN